MTAAARRARRTVGPVALAMFIAACGDEPRGGSAPANLAARPGIRFEAVAGNGGIAFLDAHGRPGRGKTSLREANGGGVALFDADGDGDLDVFLVNGDPRDGRAPEPCRLFRNEGGMRFADVTESSGAGIRVDGAGVAAADVDGDGDEDLYVAADGPDVLLLNRGDGTFEDGTLAAGLRNPLWSSSCAFGDLDGDGDLDLYVCNYYLWDDAAERVNAEGGKFRGYDVLAGPRGFVPAPDAVYRNLLRESGTLRFEDVGGAMPRADAFALGVVLFDADADGDLDVYVANDSQANHLLRNDGAWTFVDVGLESGTALGGHGEPQAGMGVDADDFDGDGAIDLFVTNFSHDVNTLYRSVGHGTFQDATRRARLQNASFLPLGFGCVAVDADLDGDLDLAVANGHVFPNIGDYPLNTSYAQEDQVFANDGAGGFDLVEDAFAPRPVPAVSRGVARGDLDGDGLEDLVFTCLNAPPMLWRNTSGAGGFVAVRLVGRAPNRDAVGARVVATLTDGRTLVRHVPGGGSFLSASARTIHVGLGAATGVVELAVTWPDGTRTEARDLAAGARIELEEPR